MSDEFFEVSVWLAVDWKEYMWRGKLRRVKCGFYVSREKKHPTRIAHERFPTIPKIRHVCDREKYFREIPSIGETDDKEVDWILPDKQKIKLAICSTPPSTSFWEDCSELIALDKEEEKLLAWLRKKKFVNEKHESTWPEREPPRYKVQRKQLENKNFHFEMLERVR